MKRLLLTTLIFIIYLVCVFDEAKSLDGPPMIDVYYIKFDYQSGHSYDALDIRKNYSTNIQVPEWYPGASRNEKLAYIKSQNNRKIKVKFYDYEGTMNSMRVYANGSAQGPGDIQEKTVYFSGQYSNETLMNFDSSVPDSIGKRNFALVWFVTEINGTPVEDTYITDTGFHVYYTLLAALLAAPQSPMSEPWTEVLDYACVWASGKTSESSALREITKGSYNDFDAVEKYDGRDSHAYYPTFDLTQLFIDKWADCQDMSAVVHVFTRAIGGSSTKVKKIIAYPPWHYDPEYEDEFPGFKTKNIKAVGDTATWFFQRWSFHQVGWLNNVYDGCIKLNENNPWIATNENINGDYKTDLLDLGGWDVSKSAKSYTTVK